MAKTLWAKGRVFRICLVYVLNVMSNKKIHSWTCLLLLPVLELMIDDPLGMGRQVALLIGLDSILNSSQAAGNR
jgi:hypothetical protein